MSSVAPEVLTWAATAVAPGAVVTGVRELGGRSGPRLLTVRSARGSTKVVLRTGKADQSSRLAAEAAALTVAEELGVAAPRLLAHDPTGARAGAIAVLSTCVPGASHIGTEIDEHRLRTLGQAAATLAATRVDPRPGLASRHRSLAEVEFDHSTSPLLLDAASTLRDMPTPDGPSVLVHGDLWQGNTMWLDGHITALIDWDAAGVGHPGIDLGGLRCDAAVLFGPGAADLVLEGWQQATSEHPDWLPYYDIVAALSTPADLAWFMPAIHQQGRTDLNAPTATARRDAFLRAALP